MKKLAIILLAVFVVTGTAMAQEGLYLGAELEVWDLSEFGDTIGTNVIVGYELEVIDNLTVFGEGTLNIPIGDMGGFWGETGFFLEIGAQYSLDMGVFFGTSFDFLVFSSWSDVDPFDMIGLNLFGGYETDTFGAKLTIECAVRNEVFSDDFLQAIELYGFYSFGQFIPGLTIWIPIYEDGFDMEGLTIAPELTFRFNDHLDFYAELPISGIGSDDDYTDGVSFGITLGAKYTF